MIIPEWLYKEERTSIKKKIQKVYNPETLKQIARQNIKMNDKELDKEIAKKMINPCYFIDENLKIGFKINLESHNINHANSLLNIEPKFPDIGIETRYVNKILKEMATIYARLINQYKYKYHMLFSANFYKNNEEDQRSDEIELFINLNINNSLTETDFNNIDVKSQLEHQIQIQETKESGWIFDEINAMKIKFYKTDELDGSSYVEIPLRSNALINIKNNDKYCFIWSILASLHPCENDHPNRVSNYIQCFRELNSQSFDFTNGFKCSDVHKFKELNISSVNIFELNFYQDKNKRKHNLIPIEISKNESDRVVDLLIYKNHYALIKKLNVFLGDHHKNFICRRCLSSYTSEKMLKIHKPECESNDLSTIRTSPASHLHWKKHFLKNPLFFRIYADFEADNEKDNSSMGSKTTNIYKQNPVLNGYRIESELEDVLQSGYNKSLLGIDNVDWFVNEVMKLEHKMAFYFKKTKKDNILSKEDQEDYRKYNVCRFCEKEILSDKVRDHCHLTGNYRGPAHNTCNINVTQKQSNFIPFVFHNFSNYDCHMFFKRLVDKKKDKVDFEIIPKRNEEYISVTYGCIRFIHSYRFLSSSLDSLVKTLVDNSHKTLEDFEEENVDNDEILKIVNEIKMLITEDKYKIDSIKILKKEYPDKINQLEEALLDYMGENDLKRIKTGFPDKWKYLTKKLAYPYEFSNCIQDNQKPVDNLTKEDFFSKLKNDYPSDEEIERTKEIIKIFDTKNGEELTEFYLKSDILLLACVFEKFIKVSFNEFGINPLYCVSLPGYTWECGLKYTGINLQALQDKDMILNLENNIRGGISSEMGNRYVKSDDNKKIMFDDSNNMYGHSMSQPLPYDKIEMWHGHPDLYMNNLEEILCTLMIVILVILPKLM